MTPPPQKAPGKGWARTLAVQPSSSLSSQEQDVLHQLCGDTQILRIWLELEVAYKDPDMLARVEGTFGMN